MRKEIKKSYVVINTILTITMIILLLNIFFIKNTSFLFCAIIPAIVFLILLFIYGYEKKNRRFTYESIFYIFSYTILFTIATYIMGIFIGFYSSVYSFSFSNLIKNIIPYILIIISCEYLRSEIVRKCDNSFMGYLLITIILILIDCTVFLTTFNLSTGDGKIMFICSILLPSVSKNFLLLYISRIGGVIPTIVYRVIMDLKMFILPIFPDFGTYIESVISTVFPVILGFMVFISLKQYQNKEVEGKTIKHSKLYSYGSVIVVLIIVITMVLLTSCKFKYGAIAIGSGSMTKAINKGDVVIYKRLDNYEIKKDDIIAFNKENRIIVHRVIDIVYMDDNDDIYYTKGDANSSVDGYPLRRSDIVGVYKGRIRFIGYPSVELHELLSRK